MYITKQFSRYIGNRDRKDVHSFSFDKKQHHNNIQILLEDYY